MGVSEYFAGSFIPMKTVHCSAPETIDIQSLHTALGIANSLVHKLHATPDRRLRRVSSKQFDGKSDGKRSCGPHSMEFNAYRAS